MGTHNSSGSIHQEVWGHHCCGFWDGHKEWVCSCCHFCLARQCPHLLCPTKGQILVQPCAHQSTSAVSAVTHRDAMRPPCSGLRANRRCDVSSVKLCDYKWLSGSDSGDSNPAHPGCWQSQETPVVNSRGFVHRWAAALTRTHTRNEAISPKCPSVSPGTEDYPCREGTAWG